MRIAAQGVCNKMWRFMANYDLLLTPTLAVPPFPVHMQGPEIIEGRMVRSADWLCFTFPANLTGQPAASVPAGFTTRRSAGRPADRRPPSRRPHRAARLRRLRACRPWAHRWPALLDTLGL